MRRLATFVRVYPRSVLAIWVVVLLVSGAFAARLESTLKAGGFVNPRADSATAQTTIERAFKQTPNSLLVVLHDPSGDVRTAVPAARAAANMSGVSGVTDYTTAPSWVSADDHTTFLKVDFSVDNTTVQNLVPTVRADVAKAVDRGVAVDVTGQPALDYALNVHSKQDASRAEMIAFPVMLLVLLLVFRSVIAMFVPLLMAGASLAVSSAIGYLIGRGTDLSILYSNIVSMIGLAVSVDYSLFIIKRFREELAAQGDVDRALRTTMRTAGHSVVFSGLTVVVGLSTLFIPRVMAFTSIGVGGVVVTAVALLLSTTALPAILRLLGHRINWGTIGSKRQAASASAKATGASTSPATARLGGLLSRPGLLATVLLALFVVLGLPIGRISLQSPVASASILPAGDSARVGLERIKTDLGQRGLFPVQVLLTAVNGTSDAQLIDAVDKVVTLARATPNVADVAAVTTLGVPTQQLPLLLSPAGQANLSAGQRAALTSLWGTDGGRQVTQIVITPSVDADTTAAHDLVRHLRSGLTGVSGSAVTVKVTGATAQGIDFDNTVVGSLPIMIGFVVVLTLVVLLFAFRSVVTSLLALAFNGLVVTGAMGVLSLVFHTALHREINSVTPILLFAVMFGLSMDYMVIMISRIREAYEAGAAHGDAVRTGLRQTAGMVNGGAAIMVAVFASFCTAQISIVQELGFGLGAAVALDAVVVRLLLMPAILLLIGPRLWGRGMRTRSAVEVSVSAPTSQPLLVHSGQSQD